ncbi:hypothetical protein AAX06_06105 [Moraxella bovoculi]|uniref:Uncharacterized protein n=1 Tax=Moraxella bovoculi TaxID=386891 RepID=A0AAC8PW27_9GAMM|nr:hypothetical protein [Moraxella bovoculi]AKG07801.1 hypothetical protein AAX06_06105 [Moraxella bovoculi]AKG11519.1 hypothetical protein AAX07_05415 [Moraxella bovoculi]AKG13486.1 hypothetical protein AAX11_04945 [Moraxella bovoculi]
MKKQQYASLLKLIFFDISAYLKNFKYRIHIKQKELKGTPNFTFKGDSYILSQDETIKSLDTSLRGDFTEYLSLVNDVETKREIVAEYVAVNVPRGTTEELITAFPKSYLEDWYQQTINAQVPDSHRPKDYLVIKEILDYMKVFDSL